MEILIRKSKQALLLITVIVMSSGFFSKTQAQSQLLHSNPCTQIAGRWEGKINFVGSDREWFAKATGQINSDRIHLSVFATLPATDPPIATDLELNGSCDNGKLSLTWRRRAFVGSIFGGLIELNSAVVNMRLKKLS